MPRRNGFLLSLLLLDPRVLHHAAALVMGNGDACRRPFRSPDRATHCQPWAALSALRASLSFGTSPFISGSRTFCQSCADGSSPLPTCCLSLNSFLFSYSTFTEREKYNNRLRIHHSDSTKNAFPVPFHLFSPSTIPLRGYCKANTRHCTSSPSPLDIFLTFQSHCSMMQ